MEKVDQVGSGENRSDDAVGELTSDFIDSRFFSSLYSGVRSQFRI